MYNKSTSHKCCAQRSIFYILVLLLLAILLSSGCVGCSLFLTHDLVKLPVESECPGWDTSTVMDNESNFGVLTRDNDLKCALAVLRASMKTMDRCSLAAKICSMLADSQTDQKIQERFASEGVRWAEISLNLGNWFDGETHYSLAINLGMAVQHKTYLALKNLKRIIKELKRAWDLDPDIEMGGPQRVLAMIYLRAPGWPKGVGDIDKAADMLKKVCAKYPDHPLNHIFYAEALWVLDEDDALDKINFHLERAASLIANYNWGYAGIRWLKQIHKMKCQYDILQKNACK